MTIYPIRARKPRLRGFAALQKRDPELLRRIAQAGGQASHAKGKEKKGHEWTIPEAQAASQKGVNARRVLAFHRALAVRSEQGGVA